MFAMVSATALGACSQSPAPIMQGNQVLNTPGSTLYETASAPVASRNVEVAQVAPLQPVRRTSPKWQETADIGSSNSRKPLASIQEVDAPVKRQPKLRQTQARITDNSDIVTPVSQQSAALSTSEKAPVELPRAKPKMAKQVAEVTPRARPKATQLKQKDKAEILTLVQKPKKKAQSFDTKGFVDVPQTQKSSTSLAQVETQKLKRAQPNQPEIAVSKSKDVSFSWPVTGPVITRFGLNDSGKRNEGINIAVREGARVRSAEAGTVAYVGNELTGYGNLLLVRHDSGYVTAYAHNKELLVKKGDSVQKGDVIAYAGMSGSVDEPQLHFEVRKGVNAVDPMKFLGRPGARS